MPCAYCGCYDHTKEECPRARKDRRTDLALGRLILIALFPVLCIGSIAGLIFSALRAGFKSTMGLWDQALDLARRRPDPPESA